MKKNKSFRDGIEFAFHRAGEVVGSLHDQLEDARERALAVPDPIRSSSTGCRINALPHPARWIFEQVLDAMQDADEMGGPEGQEYIDFMYAIIEEATERAQRALAQGKEQQP